MRILNTILLGSLAAVLILPVSLIAQTEGRFEGIRKVLDDAVASGEITSDQASIMIEALVEHGRVDTIADVVAVSMYRSGIELGGFRVRPRKNPGHFKELGFQPNDVITSVNGSSLENTQQAMDLYRLFTSSPSATFTVLRGDRTVNIEVNVKVIDSE